MLLGRLCHRPAAPTAAAATCNSPHSTQRSLARTGAGTCRQRSMAPLACASAGTANGAPAVDLTLNPRVAALKPSKTMALTDLARSLREQGQDVIGLAAGEPDFDTPSEIVEAGIAALREGHTRYTPNTGTAALRQAICDKLQADNGLRYGPGDVVVSNGAKQAIWQALLATCAEGDEVCVGDEVIIPAPYWVSYPEMARLAGARSVVVDTSGSGFVLTAEALRAALTPQSRLLILCTPSNPTGAVYSREALEAIAEIVRSHPRLLVLSDEIYEYIVYAPARHVSFGTLPDMFHRTLTVNGFSKAYAMTGWRLGYLAAPAPFAAAAASIQSQSTSGASSIAQHAALTALALGKGGRQPVQQMVAAFQKRRDFLHKALSDIAGVRLPNPDGAFYMMPDVSAFIGPDVQASGFGAVPDVDALCRYLIEAAGVALVPGDAFGAPSCLRISYAMSMPTLEEAARRIAAALDTSKFTGLQRGGRDRHLPTVTGCAMLLEPAAELPPQ